MTNQSKLEWKVALVIAGVVFVIGLSLSLVFSGCAVPQRQIDKPINLSKAMNPCDPDPCPPCTNCLPTNTVYSVNTNGVYLWQGEVINTPGETPPVHFVVHAYNLTNGVTYYWERAQENLQDWIPLTSFVATGLTASRTNGIPNPARPYYFRLRWQQ